MQFARRCAYAPWCSDAVTYPKAAAIQLQLVWQVMKWGRPMLYDDEPSSGGMSSRSCNPYPPSDIVIAHPHRGHLSEKRKRSSLLRASVWRLLLPTWQHLLATPSLPSGGECIINKSNPINVQISWQRHRAMLAQMQMQASSLSSSSPAQTNPNPYHSISSHPIPAPRHSQFSFLSWHESECTFICMTANYSGNLSASPASSHPPKSRPTPPLHSPELNACLCIRNI